MGMCVSFTPKPNTSPIVRMRFSSFLFDCYSGGTQKSIFKVATNLTQNSALINAQTWTQMSNRKKQKCEQEKKNRRSSAHLWQETIMIRHVITATAARDAVKDESEDREDQKRLAWGATFSCHRQKKKRGTTDEQRERRMWRQSHGWIKKKRERIPSEGEEKEGKTYGSDYKPVMSCVHVR